MPLSFQPNLIRRDSSVPIRLIAGGAALGCIVTIAEGPVQSRLIAVMAFVLLGGGLLAATLVGSRNERMIVGASAGAIATFLGYRFAIDERLIPAIDEGGDTLLDKDLISAMLVGASVLAMGVGGLLEALRAQSEPGQAPVPVRIVLVGVGVAIAAAICSLAGVSTGISILAMIAAGAALVAIGWLRAERPPHDFQPAP